MFRIVMFKIMIMTKMKMFKILPKIRLEDRFPVYPAEFIGAGNYEEELVLFSFTNPCITSISRDFPTLNKILLLLAFSVSFRWGCRQTSRWCRVFFKSLVTRPTAWESGTWDTAARNTCPITGIRTPQWQHRRALGSCIVELHWSKPEWQNISRNSCILLMLLTSSFPTLKFLPEASTPIMACGTEPATIFCTS